MQALLGMLISAIVVAQALCSCSDCYGADGTPLEKPTLRYIGSSHPPRENWKDPPTGLYWTPTGKRVTAAEDLDLIGSVQGYSAGRSRCLFFFFTHPDFNRSFGRVSIIGDDGAPIAPRRDYRTSFLTGRQAGNGVPAIIALAVYLRDGVPVPDRVSVILRCTLGDWTRVESIASERFAESTMESYPGATLLSVGESIDKQSFATVLTHDGYASEFRFFVRASVNGSVIEPSNQHKLYKPATITQFGFREPLSRIDELHLEKRRVHSFEYSKVRLDGPT